MNTFDKIYDEDGNVIDFVNHPKQIVKIKLDEQIEKDDMIRIKCEQKIVDKKTIM